MSDLDLKAVIEQIGKEKNIERSVLVNALEIAMLSAARKKLGPLADLEARFNEDIGEVEVYEFRRIVRGNPTASNEIRFEDAQKLDPELTEDAIGEDLGIKLDSKEFGRIAAQNAKQIIVQRVREAERNMVFNEYKDRKDELVTGIVRRFERGSMIVDLGRAEAVVPVREQVQKENIRLGDRVVAYVLDVLEVARGAQIVLSRTHPNLVARLFEQEVPEIVDGIVTIEAVAREPGFRSKIAVSSKDSDVDPVGACVGMKGARVQSVVQELRGEKIDIVPFDADEARFVCNALAPAEVTRVLVNESEHSMQLVVPDDQLSLAIGRRGQNVRLAAELTGWKIDVQSETKIAQERELAWASLSRIEGLSEFQIQTLYNHGIRNSNGVANAADPFLESLPGLEKDMVKVIKERAKEIVKQQGEEGKLSFQKAREEARALMQMSATFQDESKRAQIDLSVLKTLPDEHREKLKEHGFEDIVDVYLEANAASLVSLTGLSLPEAEQVYKDVQDRVKSFGVGQ
jgi:N utilization substance protein A